MAGIDNYTTPEDRARMMERTQDRDARHFREALAAADAHEATGAMSSLEKKAHREASAFSLDLFRGIANSPVFKLGLELDAQELSALVTNALEDEPIPKSLRPLAREIVGTIATLRAGGNRQAADEYARAQAQVFSARLRRTAWKRDDEADTFDPRAVAQRIDRGRF